MRIKAALIMALAATPAWADRNEASGLGLSIPIDMLADATPAAEPDGPVAAQDATPAEIAYGHFQRGAWIEAREVATPLAEAGDGAMAVLLARIHGEGLGVVADAAKATSWLEQGASAGDPVARHDLAIALLTGRGATSDELRALTMLRALAREGHVTATFDLAQVLLGPDRSSAERAEGETALRAAADRGLPQAKHALALQLELAAKDGDPTARDAALRLLVAAARSGLPEAQMELGDWLMSGRMGLDDRVAARGWIERAARSGLPVAAARLRRMDAAALASASALPGVEWERRAVDPRRVDPQPTASVASNADG